MATAPDILFHRYFQQLPDYKREIYRGKKDLDLLEQPLQYLLRGIQTNLNQALRNERRDVPEHVPHPPFYMDFVDSEDANAMAFTEGDYSFIGITVALIHRIWRICLPMAQSAEIATLLGLRLDTAERQGRFHVVLFRIQLNFVTTHEYTHHVHGHTTGSTLDSRFANEIDSSAEDGDIEEQVHEIDADAYGTYHVLSNLFADERAFVIDMLDLGSALPDRQDQTLLACFVIAVGTFLFVRPTKVLTPENIRTLSHPPQAARMDFIMRNAVGWCRQHRPALAEWMNPDIFDKIIATLAYVTPGADGGEGWASQTGFLQAEIGDAYMKTLAARLDRYIRAL
jgi:hypothetical protein